MPNNKKKLSNNILFIITIFIIAGSLISCTNKTPTTDYSSIETPALSITNFEITPSTSSCFIKINTSNKSMGTIYFYNLPSNEILTFKSNTFETEFTKEIENLRPNSIYKVKFSAVDIYSQLVESDLKEFYTYIDYSDCADAVSLLDCQLVGTSSVYLKWGVSSAYSFKDYLIAYSTNPVFEASTAIAVQTIENRLITSYTLSNLEPGTYYFKIYVESTNPNCIPLGSNTMSQTIIYIPPPPNPATVSVSEKGVDFIKLNIEIDPNYFSTFEIYRNNTLILATNEMITEFLDYYLEPNNEYNYEFKTINSDGLYSIANLTATTENVGNVLKTYSLNYLVFATYENNEFKTASLMEFYNFSFDNSPTSFKVLNNIKSAFIDDNYYIYTSTGLIAYKPIDESNFYYRSIDPYYSIKQILKFKDYYLFYDENSSALLFYSKDFIYSKKIYIDFNCKSLTTDNTYLYLSTDSYIKKLDENAIVIASNETVFGKLYLLDNKLLVANNSTLTILDKDLNQIAQLNFDSNILYILKDPNLNSFWIITENKIIKLDSINYTNDFEFEFESNNNIIFAYILEIPNEPLNKKVLAIIYQDGNVKFIEIIKN